MWTLHVYSAYSLYNELINVGQMANESSKKISNVKIEDILLFPLSINVET